MDKTTNIEKKTKRLSSALDKAKNDEHSKLLKQVGSEVSVGYNLRLARQQAMGKLSTNILTTEVKDKTVDGYFKQIAHNFYIGKKAVWYMCRDIADAKLTLTTDEMKGLTEFLLTTFGYSDSKVRKWTAIGEDERLRVLEQENVLPEDWTTLYELSTLNDKQFETILPKICEKITRDDVIEVKTNSKSTKSKSESEEKQPKWYETSSNQSEIVRISFDNDTADIYAINELFNDVKTLINKFNAKVKKSEQSFSFDGKTVVEKKLNVVGNYNDEILAKITKSTNKYESKVLADESKTIQNRDFGISAVEGEIITQTS